MSRVEKPHKTTQTKDLQEREKNFDEEKQRTLCVFITKGLDGKYTRVKETKNKEKVIGINTIT